MVHNLWKIISAWHVSKVCFGEKLSYSWIFVFETLFGCNVCTRAVKKKPRLRAKKTPPRRQKPPNPGLNRRTPKGLWEALTHTPQEKKNSTTRTLTPSTKNTNNNTNKNQQQAFSKLHFHSGVLWHTWGGGMGILRGPQGGGTGGDNGGYGGIWPC